MAEQAQILPVRVYQTGNRITVAAPMPGLEPQDIRITVDGDRVAIRGELRGPHQHERDLLLAEWAVGPYYREIDLSAPGLANDAIAARLDTPRQIVSKWRKRFCLWRVPGLAEQPRGGRPARFSPQRRRRRQGAGV